jgi:hypothetical protein
MESKELGFTLIECISDNYRENVDEQLNHVVERLRSKFGSYTEEDMQHFLMNIPIGEGFSWDPLPLSSWGKVLDPYTDSVIQSMKRLL